MEYPLSDARLRRILIYRLYWTSRKPAGEILLDPYASPSLDSNIKRRVFPLWAALIYTSLPKSMTDIPHTSRIPPMSWLLSMLERHHGHSLTTITRPERLL
jgi:hypothetical protein